jgi:CHAT domain-containing protein
MRSAVCAISGLILAGAATLAAEQPARVLGPGQKVERELTAGETHDYRVAAVSGQCVVADLDRRGIKLAVDVIDPRGRRVLRVVSPLGNFGLQKIFVVAAETGDYRLAVNAYRPVTPTGRYTISVASIQEASSSDRLRSAALAALSEGAELANEPDAQSRARALVKYEEAIALWRRAGDRAGEALSLFASAEGHRERSEYAPAWERSAQALTLAKAIGDRWLEGKILERIGVIAVFASKATEARQALDESLSIARSVGDAELEAESLNALAWAAWSVSEYQRALDRATESLAVCRAAKHRWEEAWAWWELGFAYWALGESERSLRASNESLRLWQELNEISRQANTLISIGLVYTQIGANAQALETFQRALAVMRAVGNRGAEAFALHDIGYAQFALGDLESAQESLEQSLRVCREVQDRFTEPYAHQSLGLVYEARGLPERALLSLERALRLAQGLEFRDLQSTVLTAMARIDTARGDLQRARERIESAIDLSESVRGALDRESARAGYLAARQDKYKTYRDVLLALHAANPDRGFDAMAFDASERGRARSLLDAVAEARLDVRDDLPEDLRTREQGLADELLGLQGQLRASSKRSDVERRLGEAEERWESLLGEIRRRSPRYAALRYPKPLSIKEVRQQLDDASALVSFSVDSPGVLVFVVARDGLRIERLAVTASAVSEQVENFVGLMARSEDDSFSSLADRLYVDLIEPWRQSLPDGIRKLIILPDGALHSLPFEALRRPGEPPRRLLDDFSISYAPSATIHFRLGSPAGARPADAASLLVIGDPAVSEAVRRRAASGDEAFEMAPLPYAAVEAREVFRFGGPRSRILLGSDATEKHTKEASLEQFGGLHFATHGFLSQRFPSRSSLLLSADGKDEGFLTAREIYRLKLKSELVVLSSCQSARGKILAGEGVRGLAQAFFHAGARSVVASLWDVSDRHTADLMAAFYRHMARGEPKADALRAAKRDMLARNSRLAPRYWAPFVLLGDSTGGVPLRRPRSTEGWVIAGAALGVLLVAAALAKRLRVKAAS